MRLLDRALPLSIASFVLLAWSACLASTYRLLPLRVASHFGLSGRADGFQERTTFLLCGLLMPLLMLVVFVVLPVLLRKAPNAINLPKRAFWLAPERRDQTLATLTMYLDWFGVATVTLMATLLHLIAQANLRDGELVLKHGGETIALYLAFSAAWLWSLYKRFR